MTMQAALKDARIGIIGLGYVGLPLAVEFGKHFDTLGFDINPQRITELKAGQDRTHEVSTGELAEAKRLHFSVEAAALADRNVFIITVPTPVDADRRPDFTPLVKASQTVGHALKAGDLVIYESTVYPGATEEICVPELEHPFWCARSNPAPGCGMTHLQTAVTTPPAIPATH